jgi:surface antigen
VSNIYPFGQCTWWCAEDQPWCLAHGNLNNALDWARNWRERGGFVQMTPAVGTIACFQPGSNQADAVFGHVAVVIKVSGAEFTVSEMNGPAGPGRVDDRICLDNAGVSFLVRSTPTPPPPPPIPTEALPMFIIIGPGNVGEYFLYDDGTLIPVGKPATIQSASAAGVKTINLGPDDTETWTAMQAKSTRVNP